MDRLSHEMQKTLADSNPSEAIQAALGQKIDGAVSQVLLAVQDGRSTGESIAALESTMSASFAAAAESVGLVAAEVKKIPRAEQLVLVVGSEVGTKLDVASAAVLGGLNAIVRDSGVREFGARLASSSEALADRLTAASGAEARQIVMEVRDALKGHAEEIGRDFAIATSDVKKTVAALQDASRSALASVESAVNAAPGKICEALKTDLAAATEASIVKAVDACTKATLAQVTSTLVQSDERVATQVSISVGDQLREVLTPQLQAVVRSEVESGVGTSLRAVRELDSAIRGLDGNSIETKSLISELSIQVLTTAASSEQKRLASDAENLKTIRAELGVLSEIPEIRRGVDLVVNAGEAQRSGTAALDERIRALEQAVLEASSATQASIAQSVKSAEATVASAAAAAADDVRREVQCSHAALQKAADAAAHQSVQLSQAALIATAESLRAAILTELAKVDAAGEGAATRRQLSADTTLILSSVSSLRADVSARDAALRGLLEEVVKKEVAGIRSASQVSVDSRRSLAGRVADGLLLFALLILSIMSASYIVFVCVLIHLAPSEEAELASLKMPVDEAVSPSQPINTKPTKRLRYRRIVDDVSVEQ